MKYNLVWNHTLDFKIKHVHRASLIWNHKTVWFSITTLSCPFLNCKIQSLKYRFFQFLQIFYWFSTELVWKIWFVTLNKPQIQIGWCVLVKISNWLGKRCNLELKMARFMNKLHQLEPSDCKKNHWFQNGCHKCSLTIVYRESAGTEDRKVARDHQERKGNLDHQALMEQGEKRWVYLAKN